MHPRVVIYTCTTTALRQCASYRHQKMYIQIGIEIAVGAQNIAHRKNKRVSTMMLAPMSYLK